MLISDGVQTCALPIFRSRPSAVREKGRGTAGGEFPLVEEPQMSLPATINSQVDPAAVTRVTRLFNNTLGDILSELIQNARRAGASAVDLKVIRSEEHTYELQSLMRTPYAVFCLQKNNKHQQ